MIAAHLCQTPPGKNIFPYFGAFNDFFDLLFL